MIKINIRHKKFNDRILFENTAITIEQGDFIVITGPSGAGKTSLLNIIGCLDREYAGEYYIYNNEINLRSNSCMMNVRKKYFSYIFQDSLINDRQSVLRNIKSSLSFTFDVGISTVRQLLDDVGLNASIDQRAALLSGGEKQRLALARALLKKPLVILADEPTASLDAKNKLLIMNILQGINERGVTVVIVTHDIDLIKPGYSCYYIDNKKILNGLK